MKSQLVIKIQQNYENFCVADKLTQSIIVTNVKDDDESMRKLREQLVMFFKNQDETKMDVVVSSEQYSAVNNEPEEQEFLRRKPIQKKEKVYSV